MISLAAKGLTTGEIAAHIADVYGAAVIRDHLRRPNQLQQLISGNRVYTENQTDPSCRRTPDTDRRHLLEQFRFVDLARKLNGVGSAGTRAWIALFLGIDDRDPLFLLIKEAQPSVLERFVGTGGYSNCGQRVVACQRLMQATSDIFLGWQHVSYLAGSDVSDQAIARFAAVRSSRAPVG